MFFNDLLDIKLTFLSRFVAFSVFFSQLLDQSCTSVVLRTVCGQCFEVACPKDQENHLMWTLLDTGIFVFRSFALGVSFVSVCSNSECERNGCQNLTCHGCPVSSTRELERCRWGTRWIPSGELWHTCKRWQRKSPRKESRKLQCTKISSATAEPQGGQWGNDDGSQGDVRQRRVVLPCYQRDWLRDEIQEFQVRRWCGQGLRVRPPQFCCTSVQVVRTSHPATC